MASTVGIRLLALSFTALFLELMVIRWVPSQVRLVAYYANLMLVSSFLGLGVGAMLASRSRQLFRYFAPLLAVYLLFLTLPSALQALGLSEAARSFLPVAAGEWRFQAASSKVDAYVSLGLLFVLNAAVFVPLGDEIGRQFHRLPPLRAYSWDLGGSLAGTLAFGTFSLYYFSPTVGLSIVVCVAAVLAGRALLSWTLPASALALAAVVTVADRDVWWSPYHHLSMSENGEVASPPPPDVRTRMDPPLYVLHVNRDFYQLHGTVDTARYTERSSMRALIAALADQYSVPYAVATKHDSVLVLGAGGGMDVQMALMQGVRHVDAVEIDPLIPRISNEYSAAAPYDAPLRDGRVTLHIDDARAFLQKTQRSYDLVVFGFLDSQALSSYGASLRLDGYTYTVESFRKAFERVNDGGALSVSFFAGHPWMTQKLVQMITVATGVAPAIYADGGKVVLVVSKAGAPQLPQRIGAWQRGGLQLHPVDLATDDWPYLYLDARRIPTDYAIVIGMLLAVSVVTVTLLRGNSFGASDAHFFFMGWGFLLLQTKSIGDTSLYFGATWFVTTLVIAGVLLMVLLANWVALRWNRPFTPMLYLPLFASLALLLLVPREFILGSDYALRLLWSLLVVPLPIFFAGLIFSSTFRGATNPSALFGANLLGATIGGFCEYLGMWVGNEALSYIVIAAYLASWACVTTHFGANGANALVRRLTMK